MTVAARPHRGIMPLPANRPADPARGRPAGPAASRIRVVNSPRLPPMPTPPGKSRERSRGRLGAGTIRRVPDEEVGDDVSQSPECAVPSSAHGRCGAVGLTGAQASRTHGPAQQGLRNPAP